MNIVEIEKIGNDVVLIKEYDKERNLIMSSKESNLNALIYLKECINKDDNNINDFEILDKKDKECILDTLTFYIKEQSKMLKKAEELHQSLNGF